MDPGLGRRTNVNPLLDDAAMRRSTDSLLLQAVEETADITITDDDGDTPLHFAVKRESIKVASALITKGADINAHGKKGLTPLHLAVDYCNLEAVCLLLYHNVDITAVCRDNKVAFMDALDPERSEIAYTLLDYHDEFPICSFRNYTALHIFAQNENPVAVDLVKLGVDVNSVTSFGYSAITFAVQYENPDLFKLLWEKIDYKVLFLTEPPFLSIYLERCKFMDADFLECLYLVLESDVAFDLVQHLVEYVSEDYDSTVFEIILNAFSDRDIDSSQRICIIYILLALGTDVYFSDVDVALGNVLIEDARLLAYFSQENPKHKPNKNVLAEILTIASKGYANFRWIYDQLTTNHPNSVLTVKSYFALPRYVKNQIKIQIETMQLRQKFRDSFATELEKAQEFPSLLEICRNQIWIKIVQNCGGSKPFQFYDAVGMLNIPKDIQDIISFRSSIYK